MLKPLIRIIKTCVVCFFVCISIAIILEFNEFQHSHIIQEFSIGAACSFIVVVISTFAQYKVEYKKHFSEYTAAVSNLIITVALASDDEIVLTDKNVEHLYTEIEAAFQRFSKAEAEVVLITKKGTEKQFGQNKEINQLYIRFLKEQFNSHKSAVLAVSDKASIIRAIDAYLKCWPECYEKNHLAKLKEIIVEDRDKDQKNDMSCRFRGVLRLLDLICSACGFVIYKECSIIGCDGRDCAYEFVLTREEYETREDNRNYEPR